MPITIDDNVSPRYIEITMSGHIEDDTLLSYLDEIFLVPGFSSKDQLVDWSTVTEYAVTPRGLESFGNIILASRAEKNARADRRIACVVPEDIQYGMGRVFLAQIENLPANYHLYRNRPDALAWLGSTLVDGKK